MHNDQIVHEVELAVVISKSGKFIKKEDYVNNLKTGIIHFRVLFGDWFYEYEGN